MTRIPKQDDISGQTLSGRYELIERVGEGAMGAVYKARHTYMDVTVAVKMLHTKLSSNSELVERFQREAQAAAHIAHPNICTATDFGRAENDEFFLVMEWLDGESLEALLEREGSLTPERAIRIAKQIADGLVKAHELEIVHRDLKPANIMMVQRNGVQDFAKITDFGIAKVPLNNTVQLTQAGAAYGTPSYMSPEQVTGSEVDGRSDIYAVGIILYEMLHGKPPFAGDAVALVMAQHITHEVPPLAVTAGGIHIPDWVRDVTMRCLEKAPEDRPQSASALTQMFSHNDMTPPDTQSEIAFADTRAVIPVPQAIQLPQAIQRLQPLIDLFQQHSMFVYIGVAVGLLLLITIGAGMLAGEVVSEQVAELSLASVAEDRQEFSRQPEISKALSLQAEGHPKDAMKALDSAALNYSTSPHFQFLRGTMLLHQNKHADAFAAFGKATQIDPRYRREPAVRDAILSAVNSKKKDQRETATQFLKKFDDKDIRDALFEQLVNAKKSRTRKRIMTALVDSGQITALEPWQQISVNLYGTRKCKNLLTYVTAADESGESRLEPALRHVQNLPKSGCGFFKNSDCHTCIRKPVKKALTSIGAEVTPKKKKK